MVCARNGRTGTEIAWYAPLGRMAFLPGLPAQNRLQLPAGHHWKQLSLPPPFEFPRATIDFERAHVQRCRDRLAAINISGPMDLPRRTKLGYHL